jgi:hypothetical protein
MTDAYAGPDLPAPGWIWGRDGGALGADGPAGARADLPASLGRYQLPDPPATAAGMRAADCPVGLADMLPSRVAAPPASRRSPLYRCVDGNGAGAAAVARLQGTDRTGYALILADAPARAFRRPAPLTAGRWSRTGRRPATQAAEAGEGAVPRA